MNCKTKINNVMLIITFSLFFASGLQAKSGRITLESLLEELTSVEESALYPDPFYTSHQESSYDRASVSPNLPHWFANADGFGIIRTDTTDNRIEKVLFDQTGPGVITRIWLTTMDKRGMFRFYFDGDPTPGWTIPAYDLMKFGIPALGNGLLLAHTSYTPGGKGRKYTISPHSLCQKLQNNF